VRLILSILQFRVLDITEYVETNTNKTLININKVAGKAELQILLLDILLVWCRSNFLLPVGSEQLN
jgi:hypothetical protein